MCGIIPRLLKAKVNDAPAIPAPIMVGLSLISFLSLLPAKVASIL